MTKKFGKITLILGGALLTISLVLLTPPVGAQSVSPNQAMQTGNDNYEAGNFEEAIEIYEAILEAGIADSALYYNLGNAYFKAGDIGRAILNYRRAYHLDPRDSEITTNLMIARAQTLDRLDMDSESGLANLVQLAEEWLTLREAGVLALFLWLVVSGLLTLAILSDQLRRYALWGAGVVGFFLLIGLFSMANRIYSEQTSPAAVVVTPEVDVTSGPGDANQYVVEFTLHSGAEVRVVDSRPNWRRIALPGNNFQGWVPAGSVETVILQ